MLYLYHKEASKPQLSLTGDEHRYIFKVRRHKVDDILYLRNLQDDFIYSYKITHIDKRSVLMIRIEKQSIQIKALKPLHIGWCVIDPKSIEKVLPSLNEMGVEKITFIYCKRSQKNFQLDFNRFEKMLLNASQQSGRSEMMILETEKNLESFLEKYPQSKMLNFSKTNFVSDKQVDTIVIGCEGGFHEEEVALFKEENIVGFDTPLVLKSESAVCAVASKVLL